MSSIRIRVLGAFLLAVAAPPALAEKWIDGREAYDRGDFARAIAIWTDPSVASAKFNVNNPRHYLWLAQAYVMTSAWDKAVATARRGLDLGPTDANVTGDLQWMLARAHHALKQLEPALAAAHAAIAAQPQDAVSYKLLADVAYDLERYDDAITAVRRAIELKPMPRFYLTLGACLREKGDLDAALEELRKGVALAPQDMYLLLALGHASHRKLFFDEAAASFKKALDAGADAARKGLTLSRYAQGRYDEALALAEAMTTDAERGRIGIEVTTENGPLQVASVEPRSPAARADIRPRDWIQKIDGRKIFKSKAFKGVRDATPLVSPEDAAAMLKGLPGTPVTLMLWRQDKMLPIKVTVVREALGSGEAAEGWALQSLVQRAKGDLFVASANAEKAVALGTSGNWTRTAQGFALLEKGRLDEALAAFLTEVDLLGLPLRDVGRALCDARKGDLEKAAEILISSPGSFDPRYVPLWRERTALVKALAPLRERYLEQAKAHEAGGRFAECLAEYSRALRVAFDEKEAAAVRAALFAAAAKLPTPPELSEEARRRVVRAEVLIKEGALEAAVPEFAEALRIAPYVPRLYYNAALLHGQLRRYAEAIRLMSTYLTAAPDAPDTVAARNEVFRWELQLERQKKN